MAFFFTMAGSMQCMYICSTFPFVSTFFFFFFFSAEMLVTRRQLSSCSCRAPFWGLMSGCVLVRHRHMDVCVLVGCEIVSKWERRRGENRRLCAPWGTLVSENETACSPIEAEKLMGCFSSFRFPVEKHHVRLHRRPASRSFSACAEPPRERETSALLCRRQKAKRWDDLIKRARTYPKLWWWWWWSGTWNDLSSVS